MFSIAVMERNKATIQTWIDRVSNAGLMALVGCSIAAALAIGPPTSGDLQSTKPTPEWLFDQHVFHSYHHEPLTQRLISAVNAPVGQGWG